MIFLAIFLVLVLIPIKSNYFTYEIKQFIHPERVILNKYKK
jgi:hypothetical protein